MAKWTEQKVKKRLMQSPYFQDFVSLARGYIQITIGKTRVIIFRESIGVSYFYLSPICSVEEAYSVNEFMFYAFPFLCDAFLKQETELNLNNPARKVIL